MTEHPKPRPPHTMTTLVPPDRIESLVGARRHRKAHIGRAVATEQTVYILHSQVCKNSGIDLRECRFSLALDRGIDAEQWQGQEDRPVFLGVWNERLVPIRKPAASCVITSPDM